MRARVLPGLAALALLATVLANDAAACPNCKDSVDDLSARSFAISIYLMIGTLFSLAGGITWVIVRAARRSEAASADFIAPGSGDGGT